MNRINDKELERVSGGFVPEYETDNAGIGGGNKASLSDEELTQVTGGGGIFNDGPSALTTAPELPAQTLGSKDPQTALDIFDEQVRKALEAKEKQ